MDLTRRQLIRLGVAGAAAAAVPVGLTSFSVGAAPSPLGAKRLPKPFTLPFRRPPAKRPVARIDGIDRYVLRQRAVSLEILPGYRTPMFGYDGLVPGPTFDVKRGSPVHVQIANELPAVASAANGGHVPATSTHLHGSASKPQYDGYANDVSLPGQWKSYWWPQSQCGRTIWYHDHGAHYTSRNVYNGLAGFYRVHDDLEASLPIPHLSDRGDGTYDTDYPYDVPLMIHDATFATDGSLYWDDNGEDGVYGQVVLVNGVPWPYMDVEPRSYRFRILNGSVARSYRYSLDSGHPLTVIATDGGLLPAPVRTQAVKHGMAERYEVIIDFAPLAGKRVRLVNTSPDNNNDFTNTNKIMEFRVGTTVSDRTLNSVPDQLDPTNEVMLIPESAAVTTRPIVLGRTHSQWAINDTLWHDVMTTGFMMNVGTPKVGDVEIWEVSNRSGGWFHPLHIHLIDFRVLSRNGRAPQPYERGPKDVVYVGENETIRLLCKFGPHPGRYMIHCHNLVHEDHDMMHQFVVLDADGGWGEHPMYTDPARAGGAPGW